jgi:hypothetical protein
MIIETICKRGHAEHVDSAREEAGRCCYRRFPDGSFCDAMIVSTFVLEEPAATDCGIAEPHAPGMHPPPIDLEPDEEVASCESDVEADAGRTVREGTDRSFFDGEDEDLGEVGQGIAQRAAEARARIFGREHYPALIAVAAPASLGLTIYFTIYFWATGHPLLALLV